MSARAQAVSGTSLRETIHGLEIWCADLVSGGPALRAMQERTPRLSEWDRQNAAAFADSAAGTEWLASHIALRILLERAVGARWRSKPFLRPAHGKPYLEGAPAVFSLSHVDGLALIGIAPRGTVGVDIERARSPRVRAPRRERIEEAGAALNVGVPLPKDADARFLQAWVRLEALAKAQGTGIGRLLTRLGLMGKGGIADVGTLARAAAEGLAVHDLAPGVGLFAAVATDPQQTAPAVRWLPTSIDGLDTLVG